MSTYIRLSCIAVLLFFAGCRNTPTTPDKIEISAKNASEQYDADILPGDMTSANPGPVYEENSEEPKPTENNPTTAGKQEKKPVPEEKTSGPYRINIGDVLEISVLDEPEMTREIIVMPDGAVTYLLVGEMQAQGLTIAELREKLTLALQEFFINPYVSIIAKTINLPPEEEKTVSILGALKQPGNYTWHASEKVLDLIGQAGGLLYTQTEMGARTTANLKASYLSRNGKKIDVDFFRLIKLGDMSYNITLEPGDFVYIADSDESTVIVMGEVNFPRVIPYTKDYTLIEALSMCQGFTREAYQSRVVLIRHYPEGSTKYVEIDVNDLLHGKDIKNLMLQGGDIVYVPEQTISEYARWARFLTDMAQLVLKGYQVRDAIMFPRLHRGGPGYP